MHFRIGAFWPDGRPIAASIHHRGGYQANPPSFAEPEVHWGGSFIYAGQLWDHFGHFVLEGLSRVWAVAKLPGPILWQRRVAHAELHGWQREIFDRLGLGDREHRVVDRSIRVERLAVPAQGLVTRRFLHPVQEAALAVHRYGTPEPGRRVWLSRSGLTDRHARVDGEAAVEATLTAQGWTILRPETLSIAGQLAALETAELIAGFEGSAFHGLVLGREIRARIVIFGRGQAVNPNYELIAQAKGLDQRVLRPALEHLKGNGRLASFRLLRPAEVVDALHEAISMAEGVPEQ